MLDTDQPRPLDAEQLRGRFIHALNTHPSIKQARVAEECGVSDQAVSGWKRTGRIDKAHFPVLSRLFGLPLAYWHGSDAQVRRIAVSADEIRPVEDGDPFDAESEVAVPEVEVEVSAGDGVIVPEFVDTNRHKRYRMDWFQKVQADPDYTRVVKVRGDSMEPTLFDGDSITVDFSKRGVYSGHVYVIAVGEEVRVKRLFRMADGRVRIVSDNHDKHRYPDELIDAANPGDVAVLGRVLDRSGSGGL